jgi:ligand-binding sensor domain-containing protein
MYREQMIVDNTLHFLRRLNNVVLWGGLFSILLSQAHGQEKIKFTHQVNTGAYNIAIAQDHDGFIWFGHSEGLTKFDGYTTTSYTAGPNSISANGISSLFVDDEGLLWIATTGGGVNSYDKQTDSFTVFRYDQENRNSITSDLFSWNPQTITQDRDGLLWFATRDGICSYDKKQKAFTRYAHDPADSNSLSDNKTETIFADSENLIWIGTSSGGLNLFDKKNGRFTRYLHDPFRQDTSFDSS